MTDSLAIIDLGGQYCHLIARRLRDLGIHSDILPPSTRAKNLRSYAGVVLSGGPQSVYDPKSPDIDSDILDTGLPVLGICYGHHLLAQHIGAKVERGGEEYGLSTLTLHEPNTLFLNTATTQNVWMSHGDSVTTLPAGTSVLASTERCEVAAYANFEKQFYGIQFHPEVVHTAYGKDILRNFGIQICKITEKRVDDDIISRLIADIRKSVGSSSVFFLVSGGVDSTVAFALCAEALPRDRILGLHVDTGLMRKHETEEFRENLKKLGLLERVKIEDESKRFVEALSGVGEPERKREIIGRLFVDIQAEATEKYGIHESDWLLGQGTIYPDTIESGGRDGRAAVIKTHHNRCPEILEMLEHGRVLEPLAEFYKDEVRKIGALLGLGSEFTNRWPFPGPGLAIRCLCADEVKEAPRPLKLPDDFSTYAASQQPIHTVGVQGDSRTYRQVVTLRGPLDYDRLQELSSRICNMSNSHNRVIVQVSGPGDFIEKGRVRSASIDPTRLEALREADYVARSVMEETKLTDTVWQFPVVLIPLSCGKGDSVVLRPVNSEDGMTANFARLPVDVLRRIAKEITEIDGIDAVFLDTTHKPPATIEWE